MILQHPRCQVSIGTIRILKTTFKYCQIVIGKDFKAGRSLELDQALEDPNCTPLLLYPSHDAVDIQTLMSADSLTTTPSTRYFCQGCIHSHDSSTAETRARAKDQDPDPSKDNEIPLSYPYKLIIALDGSWSHAKIMYRCNPRLQQLTQIKFPNPPQSIYHELKPEPKVSYTSTAEAVSQAVALLGWPCNSTSNASGMTDAQLLHEDIIRPLKKMIEIQDTIQDQQKDQQPSSDDIDDP
ncbi:hypothetical protein EC991_008545 [Linnemannia zychae]|nr:hypothetical protein EC991_008545 [Linnemannia zychae]